MAGSVLESHSAVPGSIFFVLLLQGLTEARHTGPSGTVIYGNLNFSALIRLCIIRAGMQLLIPASVL